MYTYVNASNNYLYSGSTYTNTVKYYSSYVLTLAIPTTYNTRENL